MPAGESVSGVLGEDAIRFAAAMDVRHTSSTEAAFLCGRLHALEEAGEGESQRHVDAAWKAAGRERLHRWLR